MPGRVLLVVNDSAGSYDDDFTNICCRVAPDAARGKVEDIANGSWDLVVACGGDGTVRSVVNAMIASESDAKLGIVPLGTANVVSRVFGIPEDAEDALGVVLGAGERQTDVGLCHGEAFLLGCGLGLAERFVTAAGHEEKRRLGPLAYVKRLLEERKAPINTFCIESAGGTLTMLGVGLVVANVAQLGPRIKPLGEDKAAPDDGRLSLIVLRRASGWDLVRLALKGLFGRASEDSALEYMPIGKCRVSSEPKVPIQIDGDPVEQQAPFDFDVLPSRLTIKIPA